MRWRALLQVGHVARRSVLRTLRQPLMIVPSLAFPLLLLALNASGLEAATEIPGFPTDDYLTFALALAFIQGALFATANAGTALAEDISSGFFNRLSLTPLGGAALLIGQLAGAIALGLVQAVVYLAVGFAAGAEVAAGLGGVVVLIALSVLTSAAFGTIGLLMALRTGSGEAVQGLFPVLFVLLFMSSMALPRDLIEQEWFRTVATYNPVSYLIEGVRALLIAGWNGEALALGFGFAGLILVLGTALSALSLKTRMVRT